MMKNKKILPVILISAVLIVNVALYSLIRGYIKEQFHKQNKVAIHDVLNDFQEMEFLIDSINSNALLFTSKFLEANPDIDAEELIKLRDLLEVSNITIFNEKGRIEMATHRPKMSQSFYDHFSILSYRSCPDYAKMQTPNDFFSFKKEKKVLPFSYNKDIGMPGKHSLTWNDKVKKYIQVSYEEKELEVLLSKREEKPYLNLQYFGVSTPNGYKILDYSKLPDFSVNPQHVDMYPENSEEMTVKKYENSKMIYLTIPFGGVKSENCLQKNNELVAKSGEYFYVATFVFSKTEMQKQCKVLGIVFLVFTILILMPLVYSLHLAKLNHDLSIQNQAKQINVDVEPEL